MAVGFAAWLLLVWYAIAGDSEPNERGELIAVSIWGLTIAFGGKSSFYT
jgi:hypothetical protein